MAITLPFGVRIAAGLLGTAFDRLVTLPKELPSLGVSLAGQAVRTSMRVQQELAGLATRGDELLSGITARPQEHPAWATFDEDEDEDEDSGPEANSGTPDSFETPDEPPPPAVKRPRTPRTRPAPTSAPAAGAATPTAATPVPPTPMPVHGDHLLSIAELKDRLQDMDIAAVRELLVLEETGPGRAAYLTLLENRLTTLDHQNGQP
jgi:hypothetical protein